MKKTFALLAAGLTASVSFAVFPSAAPVKAAELELNVMSWEDYIYNDENNTSAVPSMIKRFQDDYALRHPGQTVKVNYSTQGTNENMYTELTVNKNHYDLACPSEYMIQKMISENMLEKLDRTTAKVDVYDKNVSPYISNLFKNIKLGDQALYDYACCYMWGTMGFVYNPEKVSEDDIKNWSAVWNDKYKNKSTIKDSVRDSYVLALGYVYADELEGYKARLDSGELTDEQYNAKLTEVFNRVSDEALAKTGNALKDLKDKLYGYEVDSGKKDMAAGKIWINFAWSGDAVYAMDFAEDENEVGKGNTAELNYCVPEEGSNIFFDGWVMPKGADVALAQEFIDFMSVPANAIDNMDYIGYTTSIASDEVFDYAVETFGYTKSGVTEKDGKFFANDKDGHITDTEVFPVDLGFLFNLSAHEDAVIYTETLGRQFSAQYPDAETIKRCTVMRHFSDEELVKLNKMWEDSKEGNVNVTMIIIIAVSVVVLAAIAAVVITLGKKGIFKRGVKKGYKVVKKDDLQ